MVVDEDLVNWVRGEKAKGISPEEILKYMVENGQDPTTAREAIGISEKSPRKIFNFKKYKKIIFIILGVLGFLLIVFLAFKFIGPSNKFIFDIGEPGNYADGETFLENVKITNNWKTTEILIATFVQKNNLEREAMKIDFRSVAKRGDFSVSLPAFEKEGEIYVSKDRFVEAGNYKFEIKIYSCLEIEKKLGKACEEVSLETINSDLEFIVPAGLVEEIFVITSSDEAQVCVDSNSCTRECLGCETGTQICDLSEEKCIDCVLNSNCKNGYSCVESSCVLENLNSSNKTDFDNSLCGAQIIDCGKTNQSINACYFEAAQNCCLATIIVDYETNISGTIASSEIQQELRGIEENRCLVYNKYLNNSIGFSESYTQQKLENGTTQEQIDQQLIELNAIAESIVGKEGTCKYPFSDLILKLEEEMGGILSESPLDLEFYECNGNLY